MKPFVHFILTRFNVLMKTAPAAAAGAPRKGLDPEWLKRRFDLFERVCLPSVDRQTEGAFQWLVFLDWATPVSFKERMAALSVHNDFLRPVYCSQFDEETALAEIRRREDPGFVRITTSLDNDDVLHPRLIESVQEFARARLDHMDPQRGFFVSFPIGCTERRGDFYVRSDPYNSFVSFVSAQDCAQTVMVAEHEKIAAIAPVLRRYARPLWCQVAHEDNAATPVRGVYWPWGGSSEFAASVTNGFRRPVAWQCAEILRSAARYCTGR